MLQNPHYHYCPQCGRPLTESHVFGQIRPMCHQCGFIYWGDFSLGVGGILWRDNKVLLVRRAHNPGKGMWTIPGGYVDRDEKIEDAVVREIYEETQVRSAPVSVLAVRDRPGERHDLYTVFLMRDLGNDPQGDEDEISDLGFYTWEECQTIGLAGLSKNVIETSLSAKTGLLKASGVQLTGSLSVLYKNGTI